MNVEYIVILVPDLGLAGDYFTEKLGFKLEPVEVGSYEGTFCRYIFLTNAIIELFVIDDPYLAPKFLVEFEAKHNSGLLDSSGISVDSASYYNFPTEKISHPNGVVSFRAVLGVRDDKWRELMDKIKSDPDFSKYSPPVPPSPPWLKPFADFELDFTSTEKYQFLYRGPDTKPGKLTAAIEERGTHAFAVVLNVQDLEESREWLSQQGLLPLPGEQNNADYIWLNNQRGYGTTFFLVSENS